MTPAPHDTIRFTGNRALACDVTLAQALLDGGHAAVGSQPGTLPRRRCVHHMGGQRQQPLAVGGLAGFASSVEERNR